MKLQMSDFPTEPFVLLTITLRSGSNRAQITAHGLQSGLETAYLNQLQLRLGLVGSDDAASLLFKLCQQAALAGAQRFQQLGLLLVLGLQRAVLELELVESDDVLE